MIVHSIIYYFYGTSIIEDKVFDRWAKELKDLQENYPEESSEVDYYDIFKDWDGTTGYHICTTNTLSEYEVLARSLIDYHRRNV